MISVGLIQLIQSKKGTHPFVLWDMHSRVQQG